MTGDIFTERIVFSLGWTFINSLWQGGFICIINWIVLLMLSKQNARLRYIVSSISLFSILLFTVISFFILSNYYDLYLSSANVSVNGGAANPAHTGIYNLFFLEFMPMDSTGYLGYFNSNIPLIITIWFWSVLFLSLKQMGGFALTQRLGHYKTSVPSSDWQKKITDLSKKLGISKPVKLLESAIVKVPTVIGYLKPIVLIPLGLLLAIPESQIETILLHELAHIKRKDFLINILQNILEVIFFFNPFVWLISANIRSEREHCCDDMVVNISGDTISYIKALANISAIDSVKSNYAMALSLNHNHLFKRIDRIIKMKNYKSNYNRVIISALVLVIGIGFLSINAVNGYAKPQSANKQEVKQKTGTKDTGKTVDKKEVIQLLEKKYKATDDPEVKKKIEQQIKEIKSDKIAFAKTPEDLAKKEQALRELKTKYEATTDPAEKAELEKKLNVLKEGYAGVKKEKDTDGKKTEQMMHEFKKKYDSTTDPEQKEEIEKKIQSLKKEQESAAVDKELAVKENEKIYAELKKKLNTATDEDEKNKIKKKMEYLEKEREGAGVDRELAAKEKQQMISDLKKKYETAADEETKTKLMKKIKDLEGK